MGPSAHPRAARRNSRTPGKTRVQDSLWTALALLLILEGLLPFVAPRVWREGFRRLTELTDGQLRFVGVVSMGIGLLGLYLLNL